MGRLAIAGFAALALAAAAAGAASGAGAQDPSAGAAVTRGIDVRDNFLRPTRITVRRGTVLRFVWRRTRQPHNVCAGSRCSRITSRSGTVVRRTVRRSRTYICSVHPTDMRLRVRVR